MRETFSEFWVLERANNFEGEEKTFSNAEKETANLGDQKIFQVPRELKNFHTSGKLEHEVWNMHGNGSSIILPSMTVEGSDTKTPYSDATQVSLV